MRTAPPRVHLTLVIGGLSLIFGSLTPGTGGAIAASSAAAMPVAIPLVQGLTLVGSASERQGDYESTLTVGGVDADGTIHLTASAELPDPAGGRPKPVSFDRDVRSIDRNDARIYRYMFSTGEVEYPGTTAIGTSAAVIADLRATGKAWITLDGQVGGLAGMVSGLLGMMSGNDAQEPAEGYLSADGTIQAVESKPVPYPMLVNDALVSLSAWHVKGEFAQAGKSVTVEWYILDDPANALSLRSAFGRDKLETTRITFPLENPAGKLENSLTKSRRAVIYGIYFDFNSATIKPQSDAVLHTIAQVMNKNPDWALNVEGHTDNIGGDAQNQELSALRAAAVRTALIQRGIAAKRLATAGYGASVPRDTNATLAGRSRNRRVELTRQ
jgi:outer membrane protein OmpA-like peptidoglycan-associated protein